METPNHKLKSDASQDPLPLLGPITLKYYFSHRFKVFTLYCHRDRSKIQFHNVSVVTGNIPFCDYI